VLVKVAEEETQTRGGILLPVNAVKKPTSGMTLAWEELCPDFKASVLWMEAIC